MERLEHDGRYHPANNVWVTGGERSVRLDTVDATVVKDEHPHPFAIPKDRRSLESFGKLGSFRARFVLDSVGNKAIKQDMDDNTYCVVEISTNGDSQASEATSTMPAPVREHGFID